MFGLGASFILLFILIAALILAFEVWMFVDAIRKPRLTDGQRVLWCVGMLFIHPIVAIVYYFLEYNRPKA